MRILLIRTSALGDVVHALPVLRALRRQLPDAHISWVLEGWIAPLLANDPDLNEIVEVSLRSWRRLPWHRHLGHWLRLRQHLRQLRPDVVLDLMGNHKAAFIARLSGCRRRVGLRREDRREPSSSLWINQPVPALGNHAVDRMLSVLQGLDLLTESSSFGGELLRPDLTPDEHQHLKTLPQRYAVILPGAGWGNKTWTASHWAAVAAELERRIELPTLLAPGPGEEDLTEAILQQSAQHELRISSAGVLSIPGLVSLLRNAEVVLGGDTGPGHLAHALHTPTIMIHGPTDPHRHGLWRAEEYSLAHRLPCSYCHKRFDSPKACLLRLSPHRVADAAIARIRQHPNPPASESASTDRSFNR
ncbi:MAG: glycosyltransferase family 9 protein [Acidobacteriota bacterium]